MKKFIRLITTFILVLVSSLSLTACFGGDGDYSASYKSTEITTQNTETISRDIKSRVLNNDSYSKYVSTYKYEYNSKIYNYTTKYDLLMKVNGEAELGEAYAFMELKSFYEQEDGNYGRDLDLKYCIVKTGDGIMFSDYTVYLLLGGNTYSATFEEMHDKIEEEDIYLSGSRYDDEMSCAFDYELTQGGYFETIIGYTMAIYGDDVVSTLDNPFIYCLHDLNKGSFIDALYSLDSSSKNKGFRLYSADNAYKLTRKYSDKKFREDYDNASYIKIFEDGTYAYKYRGVYETGNPARAFKSNTEKELKPLNENIEVPTWVK